MRKTFMMVLSLLLLLNVAGVVLAGGQGEEGVQEKQEDIYITLGTSSPGGSYYLYGGGMSSYLNSNLDGVVITAQTTKGSNENTRLLGDRLDIAFANGGATWNSRVNEGLMDSRAVFTADIAPDHFVTLEETGINKVEDIIGKKFSIGAPGSGTERTNIQILKAYGIWEQVEGDAVRLGFSESATSLKDGHIVLFAGSSALPMPAVSELATLRNAKLISLEDWALDELIKANPPYMKVTIPGGTYDGINYDTLTAGVPSCLIASKDVPEETIYQIVKALFTDEARKHMKNVYFAWDPVPNKKFFDSIDMPFHPGAERYYREAGLIK